MGTRLKAVEKKREALRLTPKQDRKVELLARWFQDHRPEWRTFVGVERAKRLGIDLGVKPSRQSLWIIGFEHVSNEVMDFNLARKLERAAERG